VTDNVSAVKFIRYLASASLFVAGVMFVLYAVLALAFNERGGATYVTLASHRLDAHRVGAVSLVLGVAISAAAVGLLRRSRGRS
jgi:hypothetical protein